MKLQMHLTQGELDCCWHHKLPNHSWVGAQYSPRWSRFYIKVPKGTIIQCYTPANETEAEVKSDVYARLHRVIDMVAKNDLILLLGEFNATKWGATIHVLKRSRWITTPISVRSTFWSSEEVCFHTREHTRRHGYFLIIGPDWPYNYVFWWSSGDRS